jgi:hypothetical protein
VNRLVAALLLGVAIIHWLPLAGVLGGERLASLYGVAMGDANLELLMRHRAVLFGILGTLIAAGAFHRPLRFAAIAAGYASVGSFLALAYATGSLNTQVDRVVLFDWIALALLLVASLLIVANRRRHTRPMFRERRENRS